MKLELYINGFLHDTLNRPTLEKAVAVERLKRKWWYLLSNNNWAIYECRDSKMSHRNFRIRDSRPDQSIY